MIERRFTGSYKDTIYRLINEYCLIFNKTPAKFILMAENVDSDKKIHKWFEQYLYFQITSNGDNSYVIVDIDNFCNLMSLEEKNNFINYYETFDIAILPNDAGDIKALKPLYELCKTKLDEA